jgi:hypothetical protein
LKGKLRVHDFHEGPSSAHCTVFRDACLKCYMDYNGLCHKWHFFCRIFIEIVHKDSILMFARFAANRSTDIFKRLPTLLSEIQSLLPEFELEASGKDEIYLHSACAV